MHVSQSLKKCIWAGEYIDLAYLLETNPVPGDEQSYKFACSPNSINKLSLTTAKPKAKVDSYNSWNKAFWVLTEIVALRDPSQCLPMVQYAAELNDNIGKFTFPVTYQYNMKFMLKKQIKPQTPWNVIDNHLWSKCFSGSAKDTYHSNNQASSNFCSQHTCDNFNYRSCTWVKCKFQHKCVKCNQTGHNQSQCHNSGKTTPASSSSTTPRVHLQPSHSSQLSNPQQATQRSSQ